ncbi:hypothetical protein [Litoreibacter halocynthiae]|uniref:hypothetical protein n=1 Tax=Litoreibacter halocynthiae TaxID=1242689 RepID=UPI00248FDDCB|nr:hypothetical protein [Litoreibacter halocynthiae]
MEETILSDKLNTLIGLINVNVAMADEVPDFVRSLPAIEQDALRKEYLEHLKAGRLSSAVFSRATACTARNSEIARVFFKDVFNYAFEGGKNPILRVTGTDDGPYAWV